MHDSSPAALPLICAESIRLSGTRFKNVVRLCLAARRSRDGECQAVTERHSLSAQRAAQPPRKNRTLDNSLLRVRRARHAATFVCITIIAAFIVSLCAQTHAHEGEDHSEPSPQQTTSETRTNAAIVRTVERNVQTSEGQFRVRLNQSPPDPRAGETVRFIVLMEERIEGGFGASGGVAEIENASVTARVMTAAGETVIERLAAQTGDSHAFDFAFDEAGDYKIFFDARTADNRRFAADFPVAIVSAPVNWTFWLGLAVLMAASVGAVLGRYLLTKRRTDSRRAAREVVPVAGVALILFAIGAIALWYFVPPRERRIAAQSSETANIETSGAQTTSATGDPALGGTGATIIISKESQLLFGIRTAPVEARRIVSGLRTTGIVRARPDARAIISPPVAGRLTLNNITLGAAVGRGQTIGSVEQVLGAAEQAEIEARRIELRTASLESQARQAEQSALAAQARTRLTQARRELQRATNLAEVGAAPRRRVEEAQTAVRLAEQEVAAAESGVRAANEQARLARESAARLNPVRAFPLVAPVTGIVTNLNAVTGQQVEPGAELFTIINLSTVLLEANIFENQLTAVRESRQATYTAPVFAPGEVYAIGEGGDGRLINIGQSVDPQTRAVAVVFEVPNPLNRLRDGMFVEITIDTSGGGEVLSVPKEAVVTEQGRTFVYVFDGGERFERRIVTLGGEGQEFYEVRSGVSAGERVVVEGIYQLRSTQPGN